MPAHAQVSRLLRAWLCLGFLAAQSPACTIFIKSSDRKVLVGNNEDNNPDTPIHLWFRTAKNGHHGYVLWGTEEQFPEGGLNDQGVFFDAAALPRKLPIRKKPGLPDLNGYAVEPILSRTGSVQQALKLLSGYNLVEQEKAQIFLADASGDAAVVHANYVVRKKPGDSLFVLTNFALQDDPQANTVCWRQRTVQQEMTGAPATLGAVSHALEDSAQRDANNATLYSDAIDLKRREFLLFVHQDYAHPVRISLTAELRKGDHDVAMQTLLPPTLLDSISRLGLEPSLQDQTMLRRTSPEGFQKAAYSLANAGEDRGALRVLRAEQERFGETAQVRQDLAAIERARDGAAFPSDASHTSLPHSTTASPSTMRASESPVQFQNQGVPQCEVCLHRGRLQRLCSQCLHPQTL